MSAVDGRSRLGGDSRAFRPLCVQLDVVSTGRAGREFGAPAEVAEAGQRTPA
jgi:hypothetical protein